MRKPGVRTQMNTKTMQHMKKREPAETQSFRRFCGRGRRTCLGCRLGQAWTQPTGLQAPTTRTAGEPAGAPLCQILPHTNEKSQVPHKRYLTFLAGAEGLEPSARGFGVDVGTHQRELGRAGVAQFLPQVPGRVVLFWCCERLWQQFFKFFTHSASFENPTPLLGGFCCWKAPGGTHSGPRG